MIHSESHPFAGKNVKLKKEATHLQVPNFGGSEVWVEDWWDRVSGKSWMFCDGNPACMIYAMRCCDKSTDNEVLYVKLGGNGHLVHVSEIES